MNPSGWAYNQGGIKMKIEELKSLNANEKTYSISFDEDESVEIVALKENRVNLIVKKE